MTVLFWTLLIMAISITIMAITLTASELHTKYKEYKEEKENESSNQ